jgi:hypothetical protein
MEVNYSCKLFENWIDFFMSIYCLLIMINVKLTPSGLTAYLSVWMGRRCAGLVGFRWVSWCFAWIAGAILCCRLLSLRFRLRLGVFCLWIYVSLFWGVLSIVGFRRLRLWLMLYMTCKFWRCMNYIPLRLLRILYACCLGFVET